MQVLLFTIIQFNISLRPLKCPDVYILLPSTLPRNTSATIYVLMVPIAIIWLSNASAAAWTALAAILAHASSVKQEAILCKTGARQSMHARKSCRIIPPSVTIASLAILYMGSSSIQPIVPAIASLAMWLPVEYAITSMVAFSPSSKTIGLSA